MPAPAHGVTVRMYRQGHGDCFLLAFPREGGGERPVFMLIDCGNKRGSQISRGGREVTAEEVVRDIHAATGGRLDLVAVTHEHDDHVNGLRHFADFDIGRAWFAWTEDPDDDLANELRRRYNDQLLGLLGAKNRLGASDDPDARATAARIGLFLDTALGVDEDAPVFAAAKDPLNSNNKKAMKVIKGRAGGRLDFLRPHERVHRIDGVAGVNVYVLGPPRSDKLLRDEDPKGDAAFPDHALDGGSLSFFAAAGGDPGAARGAPFGPEYGLPLNGAMDDTVDGAFFRARYGTGETKDDDGAKEIHPAARWRRIDSDWLLAAESFALSMTAGINNTSLVLAFELPVSRKVLLFAADAQNGNWKSWADGSFRDGDRRVTARDLLSRTVLYKVGHHGSHNATLTGKPDSPWPNLSWMGEGPAAREFTAMITAHRDWAVSKAEWDHPLPAIRAALMAKAGGRVLQLDMQGLEPPEGADPAAWAAFAARTEVTDLYIQHWVPDMAV
jgi:hypothetical protein